MKPVSLLSFVAFLGCFMTVASSERGWGGRSAQVTQLCMFFQLLFDIQPWWGSLSGLDRRELRTDKDARFWATRGKRSAWILKNKQQFIKPNGLFGPMSKRIFKPNGLFSLSNKRSLIDPNHLFLFVGKRTFDPLSIVDAEDVWTYKDSDDGDTTPQKGEDEKDDFWAIRGKKDMERVVEDF